MSGWDSVLSTHIYGDLQPSVDIKHALGAHAYMHANIHIR